MKGYAGKFLRVNLSTGTVADEPLPVQVAMDFIAGRGFGIKYLYDELAPRVDPLGEHNKLLPATWQHPVPECRSVHRLD